MSLFLQYHLPFSFFMQKLFLLLISCALADSSFAQSTKSTIKAGVVEAGGSLNYSYNGEKATGYSSTYTYRLNTFTAIPSAGYFVADNLAVGVSLSYTVQESRGISSNSVNPSYRTTNSLRLGPYVRYYKMLTDQFGFTGTLSGGYAHNAQPTQNSAAANKYTGFYTTLTPGLIFLPIPQLGIGASVGGLEYTRLTLDDAGNYNSDTVSTFGASFGLAQLTFSGTYFFRR